MPPKHLIIILGILSFFCLLSGAAANEARVIPGDEQMAAYLPMLKGQRVALFSNKTGMVGQKHILDILVEEHISVSAIFSPEHGFRGNADAGEHVSNTVDAATGVPILSLYDGADGRPGKASINKFDVLVVDIQDVGLRFYTYYITLFKLMDACAEYGKKMLLLDRPNPNGFYVDGPILDMKYKSNVGWLPIPIVHGMTLGELARMINGEHWLPKNRSCQLTIIPCLNYTHSTLYKLPIPPSPNLPNMKSVYLYPSTCLFEGTIVSLGRGTAQPFQIFGHPEMVGYSYSFTPRSIQGAKTPPLQDTLCHGIDLSLLDDAYIRERGIDLNYLINAYRNLGTGDRFFTPFFEKLVGCDYVRKMIEAGCSADEIKSRWADDVKRFKQQRHPYLLYPE